MSNLFNKVSIRKPKKNNFDLSHERKLSCQFGDLIPINCMEVMPGDKFRVSTELMARLAPLIAPIMAHCNIFVHHWYVPMRLVFDDWQKFITGGKDGLANISMPKVQVDGTTVTQFVKGKLPDYFGIPVTDGVNCAAALQISALPFRAYQLIYNEFYRDQTLDQDLFDIAGGGTIGKGQVLLANEQAALVTMRKRCWEKDYFTSALPWAQRGGDVELPLDGTVTFTPDYESVSKVFSANTGLPFGNNTGIGQEGAAQGNLIESGNGGAARLENLKASTDYEVTDSNVTINDLRRSIRLQEWLEKNARAGSRYIEQILSHFGVVSSDARLQRPEFLGGGKSPMVISEVLSTVTSESAPQGNMAGHGISVGASAGFKKFFEEHGYVITILSILPRSTYGSQGVERMWKKFDKLDFAWPEFASLGEQAVDKGEIFHDYTIANLPTDPFGYQSRYAEYKFKNGSVHGDFRDNLKHWHMARMFDALPGLNSSFVHMSDEEISRVFNVIDQTVDHVYISLFNRINAIRPLPYFGTPML